MKLLVLLGLFATNLLIGQNDSTVYKNLRKVKFYAVNMSAEVKNGKQVYEVEGKKVSKAKFEKFDATWEDMADCCPCILQSYDENENLVQEQVSCTDCGVGWLKEYYPKGQIKLTGFYKENPTNNWDDVWDRGYCSRKQGQWVYYSKKGDTLYSEFWNDGQFIKQIPEQQKVEIWDVETSYKGKDVEDQKVPVDEIGSIHIAPKFKNSNRSTNLTIKFTVSAVGHRESKRILTLDEFKSIDVEAMLNEVEIPKGKKTSYCISIYNESKYLKGLCLKVKRKDVDQKK